MIEGAFKAAIAARRGLVCVGVNGCHGAHEPGTKLAKGATAEQARTTIREELHEFILPGAEVALLADADVTSNLSVRAAMVDFMVAAQLGFDAVPIYVPLPDLGDGKSGADDYFAAGNTLDDFNELPRHALDSAVMHELRLALFDCTEIGLADRFVAAHGDNIRHDPKVAAWFAWTPLGWATGDATPLRARRETAARVATMRAALTLAAVDRAIEVDAGAFDADSNLLGVRNGVFNLKTGKLMPHNPALLVTKRATFAFSRTARPSAWVAFLERAMDGDRERIRHAQEVAGSLLLSRADRSEVVFVYGPSGTGKSVFLETMPDGLGDYAMASKASILMRSRQRADAESASPFLVGLRGLRFVACSELEAGETISESTLKDLTGGDSITARGLHKSPVVFRNTARILIRANTLPNVVATDLSVWSRILLLPFNVVILEAERDKDLRAKLAAEFPGIFRWMLVGPDRYRERGFRFEVPSPVQALVADYRAKSDTLGTWLDECVESNPITDHATCREQQRDVTASYMAWAEENGHGVMSAKLLWERLRERLGFEPIVRVDGGSKLARGFRLRRNTSNPYDAAMLMKDHQLDARDAENQSLRAQIRALKSDDSGGDPPNRPDRFGRKVSRPH